MFTEAAYGSRPDGRDYCWFLEERGSTGICRKAAPGMYGARTFDTPQGEQSPASHGKEWNRDTPRGCPPWPTPEQVHQQKGPITLSSVKYLHALTGLRDFIHVY